MIVRPTYYEAWLDIDLTEESQRFHALAEKVEEKVILASNDSDEPDAWSIHVLPYIPIINSYLKVKNHHYDLDDYQILCKSLLKAALESLHDLESHSRIATCLYDALHQRRRDLYDKTDFTIDWQPLFECLKATTDPAPHIEHMMSHNKLNSLCNLITEARRFFRGPDVMRDVWLTLSPSALTPPAHAATLSDRILALIHLGLLLPTHSLKSLPSSGPEPDLVQSILDQSVAAWWLGKTSGSEAAGTLWIKLISRILRHDRRRHLNVLSSSFHHKAFVFLFDSLGLQVGTSSGSSPIPSPLLRPAVQHCANMILQLDVEGRRESRVETLISMVIHLTKRSKEGLSLTTSDQVLDLFDRFKHLIDQYLHPSNGGAWSKECASIIRNLVKALVKQVSHQQVEASTTSSEEEGMFDPEEAKFEDDAVQRLVSVAVTMASRAQFSKSSQLSMAACKALGTMAYLSPSTTLPVVVERYNLAMESASSPHQLALSLHALAYSVRPLLHSRWGMGEEQENGGSLQLLSASMTTLLPGLDANDLPKTKAVLHFFITVLLSVPRLGEPSEGSDAQGPQVGGLCLPLFLDEWSEEVVSKLIGLIENQEPATGSADLATKESSSDGSFDDISEMIGMFTNLLLSKLPVNQQRHIISFISRWILGASVHSMQYEVAHISAEVASECPDLALELLLVPLVMQCRECLPSLAESEANEANGHPPLSHSAEAKALYCLGVLADVLIQYPGDTLLAPSTGIFHQAVDLVDHALGIPVKVVQNAGSKLLAALIHTVTRPYCTFPSTSASPYGKDGVIIWGGKFPDDSHKLPAPRWRKTSETEIKQAEMMIERFVNEPLKKLAALNGTEDKSQVLALTLSVWGVLSGLNSRLEEFSFLNPPSPPGSSKISLVGGEEDFSFGTGVREKICEVISSTYWTSLSLQHPSILQSLVSCIQLLLSNGDQAYQSNRGISSVIHRLRDLYSEPGGLALVQDSLEGGYKAKGNRWPLPSIYMRTQDAYSYRVSQSCFRSFASTTRPTLSPQDLPQPFLSLFTALGSLSLSVHASVRNQAKTVLTTVALRFPSLARVHLGHALAHLAGVDPPPPLMASWTEEKALGEERALFQRISLAAQKDGAVVKVDLSPALESEREAIVKGSCAFLLSCLHSWRAVFRSSALFSATALTLLSSRIYDSQSLQPEVANLILHTLSRFVHPPSLVALRSREMKVGGRWEAEVSEIIGLRAALLRLSEPAGPLKGATFRFLFLANALLVLTSPFSFSVGEAKGSTVPIMKHLLSLLSSNSLELRRLAMSGVGFMLSGVTQLQGESKITWLPHSTSPFEGGREAVAGFFADEGNVALLWSHLCHDHQVLEQLEESKTKRGGRESWNTHSMEEKIFRYLDYGLSASFGSWPTESSHAAINDGLFVTSHAKLVSLLAQVAPDLSSSLVALLEQNTSPETLQSVTTPSQKCEQAVVSEVFGGLVASGSLPDPALFLTKALEHGTLEMSDSWSISVRYGSSYLISRTYELPPGGNISMVDSSSSKDLSLLDQILTSCTWRPLEFDHLSTQGRIKALRCLTQVSQEVRKEWGGLSSGLHPAVSAFVLASIKLTAHLLDSSYGLVLRDYVGPLMAEQLSLLPTPSPDLPAHLKSVLDEGNHLSSHLLSTFKQASETVSRQRPQGNLTSNGDKMQVDDQPSSDRDLTALGIGMSLVSKGLRAPVEARGPFLSTTLGLLPSLLAAQELVGMDLQKLATESALSLSLMKYLVELDDASRDFIASALIQSMKGEHWSERVATLLFMQKFWSCHGFALAASQHEVIKDAVRLCLADQREEVRRAASATLSGLLKVVDESRKEAFLSEVLKQSGSLFKKRKKGPAPPEATPASLAQLLAKVEGLRALLQSAPYDCPRWLNLALTALVTAANKEVAAEVKKEAVKAVMEWKRTHEQDSVAALKSQMDEDDYLEFQSIGGSSSYFV